MASKGIQRRNSASDKSGPTSNKKSEDLRSLSTGAPSNRERPFSGDMASLEGLTTTSASSETALSGSLSLLAALRKFNETLVAKALKPLTPGVLHSFKVLEARTRLPSHMLGQMDLLDEFRPDVGSHGDSQNQTAIARMGQEVVVRPDRLSYLDSSLPAESVILGRLIPELAGRVVDSIKNGLAKELGQEPFAISVRSLESLIRPLSGTEPGRLSLEGLLRESSRVRRLMAEAEEEQEIIEKWTTALEMLRRDLEFFLAKLRENGIVNAVEGDPDVFASHVLLDSCWQEFWMEVWDICQQFAEELVLSLVRGGSTAGAGSLEAGAGRQLGADKKRDNSSASSQFQ